MKLHLFGKTFDVRIDPTMKGSFEYDEFSRTITLNFGDGEPFTVTVRTMGQM